MDHLALIFSSTLIARLENGRIVLETPEAMKRRIRERFQVIPPEVSLADALIAKRQAEAGHEAVDSLC